MAFSTFYNELCGTTLKLIQCFCCLFNLQACKTKIYCSNACSKFLNFLGDLGEMLWLERRRCSMQPLPGLPPFFSSSCSSSFLSSTLFITSGLGKLYQNNAYLVPWIRPIAAYSNVHFEQIAATVEIKSPSRTRYTHTPATPRLSVLLFCKQSAACPFFVVFARLPTPSRKSPYLLPNVLFSPLAVPSSSYWLRRLFRDPHSSFAASYNDNVFH